MDKAAARRARFAKPVSTPGLVSRGDKALSQEEQVSLFEEIKRAPTGHKIRSLREAVVSSGPSQFAAGVFQYAVNYAIDNDELTGLQSSLAYLLNTIDPRFPVEDREYYASLYTIVLSFHDLDEASLQLLSTSKVDGMDRYLQAVANKDIAKWVAIVKREPNVSRRKLMLTQRSRLLAHAEFLSNSAYKSDGTWISEYLDVTF